MTSQLYNNLRANDGSSRSPTGTIASTESLITNLILYPPTNLMVVSLFVAIVCFQTGVTSNATVFFCLLAMISLAERIRFTESLLSSYLQTNTSMHWLSHTFTNFTELIICFVALKMGLKRLIVLYLIGSLVQHMLLTMGIILVHTGILYDTVHCQTPLVHVHTMLLMFFAASIMIPEVLYTSGESSLLQVEGFSVAIAVIALLIFVAYVAFKLRTHSSFFKTTYTTPVKTWKLSSWQQIILLQNPTSVGENGNQAQQSDLDDGNNGKHSSRKGTDTNVDRMQISTSPTLSGDSSNFGDTFERSSIIEWNPVLLSITVAILLLWIALFLWATIIFTSSLSSTTASSARVLGVSNTFLVTIILPLVTNGDTFIYTWYLVKQGKIAQAMGSMLNTSSKLVFFILPIMVLFSWTVGIHLGLNIGGFESSVLFATAIVSNASLRTGESNWFVGMVLLILYALIVVGFWARSSQSLAA